MNKKKIHYLCEGGIEKSVLRITVWYHEACRDTCTHRYTAILLSPITPVIGAFRFTHDSNPQNWATYELMAFVNAYRAAEQWKHSFES